MEHNLNIIGRILKHCFKALLANISIVGISKLKAVGSGMVGMALTVSLFNQSCNVWKYDHVFSYCLDLRWLTVEDQIKR